MKKKKMNGFVKFLLYVLVLVLLLIGTTFATKYYFYDSDFSVKKTDLTGVSIDDIKIGMNISEVDLSKYEQAIESVGTCNYNYDGISFKTNDEGNIVYIVADFKKTQLTIEDNGKVIISKKANEVWKVLGENYKEEIYKPEENNYRKIARYLDPDNDIYLGMVYSRYNNEMLTVILSAERIK